MKSSNTSVSFVYIQIIKHKCLICIHSETEWGPEHLCTQKTRELISTWKILQKDNNEDLTESPTNSLWHASKYKVHKLHQRYAEAVTVVEFMYLVLQGVHLWWSLCTLYYKVCTSGGAYGPCITRCAPLVELMYLVLQGVHLWWSLCTLYYKVCTSGGAYVPCITRCAPLVELMYLVLQGVHLWWSLWTLYYKVCTSGGAYVPCITRCAPLVELMYLVLQGVHLWWSLCTLYYKVCTSGGAYVPCIYLNVRWELP